MSKNADEKPTGDSPKKKSDAIDSSLKKLIDEIFNVEFVSRLDKFK